MTSFRLVTQSEAIEFERMLNRKLELCWLDLPEIQAIDVEEVVTYKVKKAYEEWGNPVMIEDTGLFIGAWNGLPIAGILKALTLFRKFSEKFSSVASPSSQDPIIYIAAASCPNRLRLAVNVA